MVSIPLRNALQFSYYGEMPVEPCYFCNDHARYIKTYWKLHGTGFFEIRNFLVCKRCRSREPPII